MNGIPGFVFFGFFVFFKFFIFTAVCNEKRRRPRESVRGPVSEPAGTARADVCLVRSVYLRRFRAQRGNRFSRHPFALLLFALLLAVAEFSPAHAQECRWDGTSPFCGGQCGANETEVTRLGGIPDFWVPPFVNQTPPFGAGCLTGTKALCCKTRGRSCRWDGTAPFCEGECRSDETQSTPPPGSSSGSACWTGSKVYCCSKTASTGQGLTERNCAYGPGTCIQGFVWREAAPGDRVCVTPETREQIRADNAQAGQRRNPRGGPYGPDTCLQGYVWRDAFPGDHVCVTPQMREQAAQDNRWAAVRNACP